MLFYLATFLAMAGLMWVVFENFGYNGENFLVVTAMLLPLSLFFGYVLSKVALEPLFITNDLLDRLLKDTLHELNIPLATVFANVAMLKKGENDPKRLARLERIEKAGEKLGELYEDLDYFIKKEIGTVERELFDLDETIRNSIVRLEEVRGAISIQYDSKPRLIVADRRGCQKAIDNLLSNAIKYNRPGGSVRVAVNDTVLEIADTGKGMDETTLFHIFDRYYQSDLSASGYGIGMHIVKTFCDDHRIPITIDSKVGRGTVFRLDFAPVMEEEQT
jgi:signal transduction histidine kinase